MNDAQRRLARTAFQTTIGLAAGLPLLVHTAGLPDTLPGLGTTLVVAAAVTRVMALPQVERHIPGWLQAAPAKAALPPITAGPAATGPAQPPAGA